MSFINGSTLLTTFNNLFGEESKFEGSHTKTYHSITCTRVILIAFEMFHFAACLCLHQRMFRKKNIQRKHQLFAEQRHHSFCNLLGDCLK